MKSLRKNQKGFTLMEIVVATTIFAGTVTLMLGLLTSALRINRRVEGLRQVAQGSRNFTEMLTREIRNGRIDYSTFSNCNPNNYISPSNQTLAISTFAEEKICFYLDPTNQELMMSKVVNGSLLTSSINPQNFKIKPDSFRFIVRPKTNPDTGSAPYNGVQPIVTIYAVFETKLNETELPTQLPYQTSIATDVYDIPHEQ